MYTCVCSLQFDQFMKVIREMLHKVEVEQQAHLDQLSKMEEQTKYVIYTCTMYMCLATYYYSEVLY